MRRPDGRFHPQPTPRHHRRFGRGRQPDRRWRNASSASGLRARESAASRMRQRTSRPPGSARERRPIHRHLRQRFPVRPAGQRSPRSHTRTLFEFDHLSHRRSTTDPAGHSAASGDRASPAAAHRRNSRALVPTVRWRQIQVVRRLIEHQHIGATRLQQRKAARFVRRATVRRPCVRRDPPEVRTWPTAFAHRPSTSPAPLSKRSTSLSVPVKAARPGRSRRWPRWRPDSHVPRRAPNGPAEVATMSTCPPFWPVMPIRSPAPTAEARPVRERDRLVSQRLCQCRQTGWNAAPNRW